MLTFPNVIVAMVTPFHEDGSVNYEAAVELAKKYADEKVADLANGAVKTNTTNIAGLTTRLGAVEGKYVAVENDKLVTATGDTIIFDCGVIE